MKPPHRAQEDAIDIRATLQQALDLRDAGRPAEAEALCAQVVAAAPRHEGARYLQGLLAQQTGRLHDAEAAFREAAALAPALAPAHLNLALTLRRLGRQQEAIASYDRVLALEPGRADVLNSRGVALLDLKRRDEALAGLDAAIAADPTFAAAHANRGLALLELERPAEALVSLDVALGLSPDDARAHFNKGNALVALGRAEDAVASYDAALARSPHHVEALANRAVALIAVARPREALASSEAAIALRPDDPMLWLGRGNALSILGRHDEAIEAFDRVATARPDFREAVYNRGLSKLALGRFREGWIDYEARWETPEFVRTSAWHISSDLRARFDPAVRSEDLAGRRVLVVSEQGVGDIIMFASILADLAAIAGSIAFTCEPRFLALFQAAFPGVEVREPRASDADAGAYDHVLPIGGLGRLFRNAPGDFPGDSYLSASPAVRDRWVDRLGPSPPGLRIGLSWRGGLAHTRRRERSLPLAGLGPVLDLPDCQFVSLQHGDATAEIAAETTRRGVAIRAFAPDDISDFEQLAGLVQALDAVVSVQTAVVHLAGAVGTPCFAMTPGQPEWRYAAAAPRLLWYDSVTVVRQTEPDGWDSVLATVVGEVRRRVP